MVDLAGLELAELESLVESLGHKRFRAKQIYRWIWKRGVTDFAQMTDLSQELRAALAAAATVSLPNVIKHDVSEDGTQKFVLRLSDGKQIESVFIPDTPAQTFCVSTQVGCAMGCAFCLTGKMGLVRNLSAGEITAQVRLLARSLDLLDKSFNIVLMGMGEPLHNYDATMKALRMLNEKEGLALHPKRVTLSTVGLVPMMDRLAGEALMPNLAVSLHAANEDTRGAIVPLNKKYSMQDVIEACERFPLAKRRRIMFEYVLLAGVNDSPQDARKLVKVLSGVKAKVNLLPLNAAPGIPFERPSDAAINAFAKVLADRGLNVSVRKSRGRDIRAACGQLIVEGQGGKKSPAQKLGALLGLLFMISCAGEPQTWRDLRQHVGGVAPDQREAAIEKFIAFKGGNPIVESQTRLVFFARDKNGQTPRVVGDFNAWASTPQGYDASIGTMTRIDGTQWSYLEGTAYTNARVEYVFMFDQETVADPLNPRVAQAYAGPRSEVRMPFWTAQPEVDDAAAVPAGELLAETIASRSLGGTRRVWFYLPPGYPSTRVPSAAPEARSLRASTSTPETLYPVVYVLDGSNYVEKMDVPRVLDRLIARKVIPPVIAVFSEPGDRREEYSRNPKWRAFVSSELVPMVDKRFRTFPTPDHRAILGSSLAGYGAVDLAVEYPAIFGLCAAIAPPEQTASVIANQAKARAAAVSIKFFVLGGVYDSMINGARGLRTTLDDVNAPVTYLEVPEGHNTNTFRAHLDDALKALLVTP